MGSFWNRLHSCLKEGHKFALVKYLLLFGSLAAYAFAGSAIFYFIEKPAEEAKLAEDAKKAHAEKLEVVGKLVALAKTCGSRSETACYNATERLIEQYDDVTKQPKKVMWTFWTAYYYSSTIITTIGFGNVYCRTRLGQGLTLLYALVGIPIVLTVLKYLGESLFKRASWIWARLLRRLRHIYRVIKKTSLPANYKPLMLYRQPSTPIRRESFDYVDEESIPLPLALLMIFLYMLIVAGLICWYNRTWTYFDAFYYFFITLSTVGLGDKIAIPEGHSYVLASLYTMIGLALVSMCLNVLQNRMERTYKRALSNMITLLQLSDEICKEMDENHEKDWKAKFSPVKDHPDFDLFRASAALSMLQMRRHCSRPEDPKENYENLFKKNPIEFRHSVHQMKNMIHRKNHSLKNLNNYLYPSMSVAGETSHTTNLRKKKEVEKHGQIKSVSKSMVTLIATSKDDFNVPVNPDSHYVERY